MNNENQTSGARHLSERDCFYISERHSLFMPYPIHCHAEYELTFTENGQGAKRIVGDSQVVIGNMDLVLITGKDLEHVWERHECSSTSVREITLHFSPDLFVKSFLHKNQFRTIQVMLERARRGLAFSDEAIRSIYPLLDHLPQEERGFYAVLQFMTILYELSLDEEAVLLSSTSYAHIRHAVDSKRINKIQDYVETHYMNEIRLHLLADMIGMTTVSFSRYFKQVTGQTFSDYLIALRLDFASRMLVDTSVSIAEICYDCGFNNLSNFNRIFRKNKHCSPKEYRETYRKQRVIV